VPIPAGNPNWCEGRITYYQSVSRALPSAPPEQDTQSYGFHCINLKYPQYACSLTHYGARRRKSEKTTVLPVPLRSQPVNACLYAPGRAAGDDPLVLAHPRPVADLVDWIAQHYSVQPSWVCVLRDAFHVCGVAYQRPSAQDSQPPRGPSALPLSDMSFPAQMPTPQLCTRRGGDPPNARFRTHPAWRLRRLGRRGRITRSRLRGRRELNRCTGGKVHTETEQVGGQQHSRPRRDHAVVNGFSTRT